MELVQSDGIDAAVEKIMAAIHGHDSFNKRYSVGTHVTSEKLELITDFLMRFMMKGLDIREFIRKHRIF